MSIGAAAYAFLAARHDQYGTGSTLRLPQSYDGGSLASIGVVSSFTYDNAPTILAWLASGASSDPARTGPCRQAALRALAERCPGNGRSP
ncbi:hypothetical protein [Arthrobacter sp. RIT-PI-e]|uniref:hypothetical protein n=1 Tax=Arthrobacter sp. RIT-PI-e TaxID=1681197 RepID=UPI000A4C65CD|nr:hypothetical protein [Arthrobacter sp. RIT-PI-e]